MKTVREYLRHAEECDALAQKAMSADQRQMIADMSCTWRMLAEQRRARILKAQRAAGGVETMPLPTVAAAGESDTPGARSGR